MAHYDIFRHQLLITAPAYGYALWDPDPGNLYPAVEVGDVGYIREGKFHRLFNALLPAEHPSHENGVPDYHEQLDIKNHINKGTLSPHNFCSTSVTSPESDLQANGPKQEGEVSFLCRMNQGAVLCLPIKAKKEDTVAIKKFGKCMIKHIDTWFAWAQQLELGVDRMEDIILVTGTHRTRSYTNVAFPGGREDAQASFRANLKVDHPDGITINWQLSHEHTRGAHLNPGPDGKDLPEDQCIFIRGFRVIRKYKIFPRLKGAAGPNPDPEGYDEEPDMELVPVPAVPEYRDPLHILLEFIAEEVLNCDMALVHDNDLAELHGMYDGTPIESLQPDAMLSYLRSAGLKIHEIPFGPDLLSVDNGGNTDTETVCVATLSNIFEVLSPSSTNPSSQSRVKDSFPQIKRSLFLPSRKPRLFGSQSSKSRDTSATLVSHAYPGSSTIKEPIELAFGEYEQRTGINILEYHLVNELKSCDSAYSVIEILQAQSQRSQGLHGGDLMMWVKPIVHLLHALSTNGALEENLSVLLPPTIAIFAGIGVLLDATKRAGASNDALVNLFESIENLLRPLDVYTKIRPTTGSTIVLTGVIFIELLSILALGAQQVEQGLLLAQYDTVGLGSNLFGINGVDVVLQRLDRLNQEESWATAVQTLEVVLGLLKNMKVVMNGGESSISELRGALVSMQQVTNNMNKAKRDQSQTSSQRWLSPPDPSTNHNILCDIHHSGTTAWVMQRDTFREWTTTGSLLWVHGKLGSGKSVLCSTIIEDIEDMWCETGLASLAYFYFDVRDTTKQDIRGLLTSLLFQLSARSNLCCEILSTLYHGHESGSRQPSNDVLTQCLKDMLTIPGKGPVYIIVDAIDECPNIFGIPSPRESVLGLLDELVQLKRPGLHICVTSRLESDIETILRPLSSHSIFLDDNTGNDIFDYISAVVNTDRKMRTWTAEDQRLVIDTLSEKSDGTFRWASCQLDALRRSLPINIRRVLGQLPKPLYATYENALERIDEENWEYAHRLFQCLTVTSRPLRVEELAEFLVFDFSGGPGSVPKFVENRRHKSPREAVLSICSGLVTVVEDSGHRVVQFSHFSFRQFLTSGRLAMARGPLSRYHVSPERAHTIVAQVCLGLLLQPDRINGPKVDGCPLVKYAARYWVNHAQFGNVSSSIRNAMESLFDPNNPYFMLWVSAWDIDEWSTSRPLGASPKPTATALYYAALCGFRDVVGWLVTRHLQDVNARGGNYVTPLHATSARGYLNVALFLLEHGADVNLAGNFGQTPLHLAAKNGHLEVAALLLKHGADPNAQDTQDLTPLHCAAHEGQLEVMRVLLLHGAGIAHDKTGATALLREIVGEEKALSTELGTEAGDLSTEDTIVVRGASAEAGRAIKKILEIVEDAKTHSSSPVGFEVDREYVGSVVGSQRSGVNKLRGSLGVGYGFSDGGDGNKNASKRKETGLKSSVKRSTARVDPSGNSSPRAPPATLHWKLLPFDAQRSKGKVRFDFAHSVDEILLVQSGQGGERPLTVRERNESAAEPGLTEMVIHCAELPDWPVHVWRRSGIRCVDVFEAIRDTYDVVLTGTERVIHQSRIHDIERRHQLAAKKGVRRRDLLEGKTLFLGLDWHGSDSRYPYGCWSLKVGSPPKGYSSPGTLQEHYGSTLGLQ